MKIIGKGKDHGAKMQATSTSAVSAATPQDAALDDSDNSQEGLLHDSTDSEDDGSIGHGDQGPVASGMVGMISALTVAGSSSSDSDDEDVDGEVHRGVVCDRCNSNPLKGERYKCEVCHDFDLCGTCKVKSMTMVYKDGVPQLLNGHSPDHSMKRIQIPIRRVKASAQRVEATGDENSDDPQPSTSQLQPEHGQESSGAPCQTQSDAQATQSVRPKDTQLRPRADSNPKYEVRNN